MKFFLPALVAITAWLASHASAAEKPNVVFILADDLGWNDISLYGSEFYETPNIDALAKRGLKFDNAYSASPLCSPTRASILTGLDPARIGITAPHCHLPEVVLEKGLKKSANVRHKALTAQSITRFSTDYFTLGEAFKADGYTTGHFGKWHLGPEPYSPLEHGFDIDLPHTPAPSPLGNGFFHPFHVWKGHGKPGDNLEDLVCDEAVKFITQNKEKPFFLNYWAFEVHSPWQAKKEQIDKYRAKAKANPKALQRNPVYAGMVETLDEVVGRLVAALEEAGVIDNTIIVFTSDNGPYFIPNRPHMPAEFASVPVTNAQPLRAGKATIYEAGTRVPQVIVWPGVTQAGTATAALMQSTDFFPTFTDLLDWKLPENQTFDGFSLRSVFENKPALREEIFCHFPHTQANGNYERQPAPTQLTAASSLRRGDWKLIRLYADNSDGSDRHELYNLVKDPGERQDLAKQNPEVVKQLTTRLDDHLEKTDAVIPKPNPDYARPQSKVIDQPNIVFILADDLGWADTTLYGHTKLYKTPNLERLAKRGMTFNRAYSASPLCSPTRSSILTGLNPARTGLTSPNCHTPPIVLKASPGTKAPPNKKSILPNTVSRLDTKYFTLGKAMKHAGYATGHFGKWHLGKAPYSPLEHGFDVDIPHWHGPGPAGSFVAPWKFPDFDPDTPNQHLEDRMAEEAVQFMEKHKDKSFFLNYWMFSVHAPFDAKKDLIEKYRGKIDPKDPQRSPTYAAMVESMDDAIGTLLDTLDRLKIADNTIIIFFSDNGGNMYNVVDGTSPTSNFPLRGGKASMFEGGVRVPMIVSWPGEIKPNTRSDSRVQSDDFYPTILDMLKLKPKPDQSFDGVSFLPALKGQAHNRKPSFTYFPHDPPVPDWIPPSISVHDDDWKLIRIFHGGDQGAHRYKLFNLKDDIGEKKNLAAEQPEQVKRLDTLIESFLNETKAVRPLANPNFNPAKYDPSQEGVGKIRTPSAATPQTKPQQPTRATELGVFKHRDKNNDNQVTLEEFIFGRKAGIEAITKNFNRRDTNKDGIWEKSEIK